MAVLVKSIMTRVEISPDELAELFCLMNGVDQAEFFSKVAEHADKWKDDVGSFEMQMQYVTDSIITPGGRRIMQIIGDYAQSYRP